MTALFYQIINHIEKITHENYKSFKKKLLSLLNEFKKANDVENIKVLRNKLEVLLLSYDLKDPEHKHIRECLKDLKKFLGELDDIILEMTESGEKVSLIDVVKKVEKHYRTIDKIKKEKRDEYVERAVKKSNIEYEKELIKLQLELVKLEKHIKKEGKKVLIIFEGRDAAGKGGNIKRFTEHLNPRSSKVIALQKPTDKEQTQWYFQRYIPYLPAAGEICFFDRSWYNRGGVEPVMGFVSKNDYHKFLEDVPRFEEMLIDSGIDVIKLYYSVSKSEQAKRFEDRKRNPLKQFKLSPIDQKSQQLWSRYTLAEYNNFSATSTKKSPWTIVISDDKKLSRINSIKYVLSRFDYPGKISKKELKYDSDIIITAKEKLSELEKEVDIEKDLFA